LKRFFCVLLAVALIMGMAVQSFAYADLKGDFPHDILTSDTGDDTFIGVLQTSSLGEESRSFLLDIFRDLCGKGESSGFYYVYLIENSSDNSIRLRFYKTCDFSRRLNIAWNSSKSSAYVFASRFSSDVDTSSWNYDRVEFTCKSDSLFVPESYCIDSPYSAVINRTQSIPSGVKFCLIASNDTALNSEFSATAEVSSTYAEYIPLIASEYGFNYSGSLGFVDDYGLIESLSPEPEPEPDLEPDEDENEGGTTGGDSSDSDDADDEGSAGGTVGGGSDDESSSSTPSEPEQGTGESSSGQITLPKIENNAVIPYDLDVWNVVLDATLPTLRKVFSIGFPLFLIFLGVQVMLGLIRKFALSWLGGSHKGGGIKHD